MKTKAEIVFEKTAGISSFMSQKMQSLGDKLSNKIFGEDFLKTLGDLGDLRDLEDLRDLGNFGIYKTISEALAKVGDKVTVSNMTQAATKGFRDGDIKLKDIPYIKPISLGALGAAGLTGLGVLASKAAKTRAAQLAAQKRKDLALKALLTAAGFGAGYATSELI